MFLSPTGQLISSESDGISYILYTVMPLPCLCIEFEWGLNHLAL